MPTPESGLVIAAKYEAELHMKPPVARSRFHTLGALAGFAVLVVGYDVLSLLLR